MNKKIVIFISFLSLSGISYFSWKVIAKDQQKDNSRQIVHQEKKDNLPKKEEKSPEIIPDDHQESNRFLFWIVTGIIIFIIFFVIGIILTIYRQKKKNQEETAKHLINKIDVLHPNINNFQNNLSITKIDNDLTKSNKPEDKKSNSKDNDDQISNKANSFTLEPKDKDDQKYDSWQCGVIFADKEVHLVLNREYDPNIIINQIFDNDIKNQLNSENKELKELCTDLKNNHEETIRNFINTCFDLLKHVTVPLLKEIKKMEAELSKNDHCKWLRSATNLFYKKKDQNHPDNRIVVGTMNYRKKDINQELENESTPYWEKYFQNKLTFFKKVISSPKPVVHLYTTNNFYNHYYAEIKVAELLFEYSYALYQLIRPIKQNFKLLLRQYNKDKKIINDIEQLQKDIKKIEDFLQET